MEYGTLVKDSFAYAKEGLAGNLVTWILLIILTLVPAIPVVLIMVIITFSMSGTPDYPLLAGSFAIGLVAAILLSAWYEGFMLKVLRGERPLPAVSGYGTLFSDGIRYIVIEIIYSIPVILVLLVTVVPVLITLMPHMQTENVAALIAVAKSLLPGIIASAVVAFIIGLIAVVGIVRFARSGSVSEAFNFSVILGTIRKIGWGKYIITLLMMVILVLVVTMILAVIPVIGSILQIIIGPFIGVFAMRYICLLYDSAGTT
jgi:hypothetical protein